MDASNLRKKVEKYNAVSFDIFDTLLKRDVYKPTDVFMLVQSEYQKRYRKPVSFKTPRIEAEYITRKKSRYAEVTLDEIYDELDCEDKETLKQLETEIESKVLHRNYDIKPVYDFCIAQGKDVYIISDMYLPKAFLEEILKREGYEGYRDLILSADYRKTKRSGELYKVLLEAHGLNNKDLIHIGDSRYADYVGARKCGINAVHIPRYVKNTLYLDMPNKETDFEKRSLFSFLNTHENGLTGRDTRLGYEVLGPILYAYCQWIHDRYEELDDTPKRLWFAARDMYLFKEAYNLIYGDEEQPDYLYISRKSLRPVLTVATGDITESGNAFPRGETTVEKIIDRMGYTSADIEAKTLNLQMKVNPRKLSDYSDVKKALSSDAVWKKEKAKAKTGLQYLVEHGFSQSNVVLADVGWHGTTQYILQRVLDADGAGSASKAADAVTNEKKIYGFYLGCLDSTNDRIGKGNYQAFAFDENHDSEFAKGILLFESLILAPHGSTNMYEDVDGEVKPVLGEPDNVSDFLKSVQAGAMQFVKDYRENILSTSIALDSKLCTEAFCRLTMEPKREELDTIGQMDYDDFGIGKMAAPKSMGAYLLHPKQLHYDLKHSPWRVGFMYRLFKIRLPYGKIYSYIRGGVLNKKT